MAATPPPLSKQEISLSRKAPDMVTTEGIWCCVARSVGGSPSLSRRAERPKSRELHKLDENHSARLVVDDHKLGENFFLKENQNRVSTEVQENNKGERRRKSGELNKGGEALKSGEIAALIKQGFLSSGSLEKSGSNSPFRIRLSPGRISPIVEHSAASPMPPPLPTSNYGKFNSLLNSGLLNPGIASSPPVDKIRSSPTLFEMMVNEQDLQPKAAQTFASQGNSLPSKQLSIQEKMLSANSPGNQFNDASSSDVKLTLSNKEGFSVTLNVHRHILVAHSRFFAAKLSDRWSKQQRSLPYVVEISDCDDIELYLETLRFMYCRDLKRKLMKESVSRVLGILKVSATIVFEAGVLSCLEYLEAVPWAEEDEEKVTSMLCQLQLQSIGAEEVLKRLSTEDPSGSEDILVRLLHLVTKGTDEKARREMKNLVSRMLRENAIQCKDPIDVSKESLYRSCHGCLDLLLHLFMQASSNDFVNRASEDRGMLVAQIARQADNLHWLVDILIDRQIADDFVKMWANQSELATLHSQIPIMFRYEVSRLTARLCIAVGKGQVLAPKEIRFMLLQNWLQPLIDDFAWMQRACKGLDRKVVEEGISQTILTLPLKQQQTIMMTWFDRFLNNGDDCPNLQRAFEVWWRRTFLRPALENEMSSREVVS